LIWVGQEKKIRRGGEDTRLHRHTRRNAQFSLGYGYSTTEGVRRKGIFSETCFFAVSKWRTVEAAKRVAWYVVRQE
jgi:hypothetical protein